LAKRFLGRGFSRPCSRSRRPPHGRKARHADYSCPHLQSYIGRTPVAPIRSSSNRTIFSMGQSGPPKFRLRGNGDASGTRSGSPARSQSICACVSISERLSRPRRCAASSSGVSGFYRACTRTPSRFNRRYDNIGKCGSRHIIVPSSLSRVNWHPILLYRSIGTRPRVANHDLSRVSVTELPEPTGPRATLFHIAKIHTCRSITIDQFPGPPIMPRYCHASAQANERQR
jgi:hypothetical protein